VATAAAPEEVAAPATPEEVAPATTPDEVAPATTPEEVAPAAAPEEVAAGAAPEEVPTAPVMESKKALAKPGTSVYTVGNCVPHPLGSPNEVIPITWASIGLLMLEVVKRAPPLSPWQESFPRTPPAQI